MAHIILAGETDWDGWRTATRAHVLAGTPPEDITWVVGGHGHNRLPGSHLPESHLPEGHVPEGSGSFSVPRPLVALAAQVIQARDRARFDLLYRLVWRAQAGEPVLALDDDAELTQARRWALAVRGEAHRMRTHVRFLHIGRGKTQLYLGWYAPAHYVLEANAQVFVRRYPDLQFAIVTPDGSAHWDGETLRFGAGLDEAAVPDDAALAMQWHDYGADMLDAARETTSVPEAEALDEEPRAPDRPPIGPVVLRVPTDPGIEDATAGSIGCRRCPLGELATQTVFGEGPADAAVVFIGEQPGDQEDIIGRPFVGPAGQMLDRALEEAGIDRRRVYITNAVKHFKFTPRGKRRIHQTPETPEIQACAFWLDVERVRLRPKLTVLMGGTAARAVLGRPVTISRERGRAFALPDGAQSFVTVHPSFLLRVPDEASKAREYERFVADLREVARLIA